MPSITLIQSTKPKTLRKSYALDKEAKLVKSATGEVSEGLATAYDNATPQKMVELLGTASEASDIALMSGHFQGSIYEECVNLVTEDVLAKKLKADGVSLIQVPGGVQIIKSNKYVSRLKRGVVPSDWMLIDADNPAGIPPEWEALNMQQRLEMLEPILPGLSSALRVEYRSSSARVIKDGEQPGCATHAWIQISDSSKLEVMREHVKVEMGLRDLSFLSPRHDKATGEVIGASTRTVIDLAVWVPGRLVFCSKPHVDAKGYYVSDAGIQIVNPGGGLLDVSKISEPSGVALNQLRIKTGQNLSYSRNGGSLNVEDRSSLKWDTPIEIKGKISSLQEVVATIAVGGKVRCETPFRASHSEAAFIRLLENGLPMLHDVGTSTNYYLTDALNDEANISVPEWVAEMNGKFAWVEAQKTFYRFEHEDFIREQELVTHFKNRPLIEINEAGLPKKSCRVRAWISHPKRAQYHGLAFAPGEAPITAKNEINTFKGFAVAPIAGDVKPYVALRDHLFPAVEERRYIEQWLAHKLKHPGTKMNTALVIWSDAQGVGKNLFFETFGEIIGPKHSCVIEQKDLVSDFNSWAKNKLFVIGDEVLSSGDRKEADRFKGLITGTKMTINEKNQPQYTIGNFTSFVFLSNHDDAVHLDARSRRYFVAEIKGSPLGPQMRNDYAKWRDKGGLAALHYYLVNDVDLAGFDSKAPAPITIAKEAMISAGRSGLEQWVADAITDPYSVFGGAVITAEMLKSQYENATGDNRSSLKAVVNAAKKAGARVRDGQIRTKDKKKVRVLSLADHDKWAITTEGEWAAEFDRVRQHLLTKS